MIFGQTRKKNDLLLETLLWILQIKQTEQTLYKLHLRHVSHPSFTPTIKFTNNWFKQFIVGKSLCCIIPHLEV